MRRADWAKRLFDYLEAVRSKPFSLASHNCALFVAGAIKEMRDTDPVAELGIKLETERDVVRALAGHGGVRGLATEYLGEMRPPLRARRGDVVIKAGDGGETLGICAGTHALFLCVDGLQARDLAECEGCWWVE